jgi:hypothetical protein
MRLDEDHRLARRKAKRFEMFIQHVLLEDLSQSHGER